MRNKTSDQLRSRVGIFRKILTLIPLVFLVLAGFLIAHLFAEINIEKERHAAEKAAAVAAEMPAVNVVLQELTPAVIMDRINLPGVIEPWKKLNLLSRVHGPVTEVSVTEGDTVKKGQVIARIDKADYRIASDAARAAYDLAQSDYNRMKSLYQKDLIPEAQLEIFKKNASTAKSAAEDAALKLSRCTVTAPISGVVRRMDAKVGLLMNVADPVAEILQIDDVKAVVGIPESDVTSIRRIEEIAITIQALQNRRVTGMKHYLAHSPENFARLYRLELMVENSKHDILPGMFFRAEIVRKTAERAVTVPLYSIISRNGEQFVFVEKSGTAYRRAVETGIVDGWMAQITKGLLFGERVVIEGHRSIEEGNRLNTVRLIRDPKEMRL